MKLVSSKKAKTLFLSSNSKFFESGKVNIIISPEFYWVRKLEIPVKNQKQAKMILPTIFEDVVEQNTQELVYQVKKLDDKVYLAFAFDNNKIFEAIKKSGINISNIQALYFAQIECSKFENFSIGEDNFIYTKDDILVKLPKGLSLETNSIEQSLSDIELSSFVVDIKFYNSSILNSKNLNFIYGFFVILALVNFIKYFSYTSEYNQIENEMTKLSKNSNLPKSRIQTNSIIKKYNSAIILENRKRELISYIFSNNSLGLESFDLDNKRITFKFLNKNRNKIEKFIKKKYKISSSRVVLNSLVVSVNI